MLSSIPRTCSFSRFCRLPPSAHSSCAKGRQAANSSDAAAVSVPTSGCCRQCVRLLRGVPCFNRRMTCLLVSNLTRSLALSGVPCGTSTSSWAGRMSQQTSLSHPDLAPSPCWWPHLCHGGPRYGYGSRRIVQ